MIDYREVGLQVLRMRATNLGFQANLTVPVAGRLGSASGTFETCWPFVTLSVAGGRPAVFTDQVELTMRPRAGRLRGRNAELKSHRVPVMTPGIEIGQVPVLGDCRL